MTYHDLIGTHYLQDINQDYLYQDVAIYNQRLMGAEHLENVLNFACRAALSNRAVAHIAIPIDMQAMPASHQRRFKRNVPGHTATAYQTPIRIPEREQIERAAQVLAGKTKIVILAGAGARHAGPELEQVAERLGAPIIKAGLGKDCVPDTSPYTTGGTGVIGTRPSYEALKACDGLLIAGSCFPYIEFLPKPGQAAALQIDDKPEHIGLRYPVDIGLVGDCRATLRELLGKLRRNDDRSFLEQAQKGMRDWWALMEERGTSTHTPMCPQVVSWHLPDLLADDAIICGDSGTVTTWQGRMRLRDRQRFSFSGTMCSMMAAVPYSIGVQTAYPDRQVVAFTGDGSATMMMGELATLAQHKLPVKVVVMKNNTLGLIKWEQMLYLGNPEYGVDLHPVDFVKVAEACGLRGFHIEDPTRCREQLRAAIATPGPVLIECVVDQLEPPWPPVITTDEQKKLVTALARGEVNRTPIGLTIGRHAVQEFSFSESPFGIGGRIMDRLTGGKGGESE
jgi:pyruvate dehydrogenase (quinone)